MERVIRLYAKSFVTQMLLNFFNKDVYGSNPTHPSCLILLKNGLTIMNIKYQV